MTLCLRSAASPVSTSRPIAIRRGTRQFIGGECVSPGGDDQFAELPHLAGFQRARLVFEGFQLCVKIPWLAHHILRTLSMEQ
jgi:hypothetical protein